MPCVRAWKSFIGREVPIPRNIIAEIAGGSDCGIAAAGRNPLRRLQSVAADTREASAAIEIAANLGLEGVLASGRASSIYRASRSSVLLVE